jgi:hypothetical protein
VASPVPTPVTAPELTGIFDLLRVARDASIDEVLAVVDTFATSARRSGVPVGRILDAVETCLTPRPSDEQAVALEWALAASRRAIGAASPRRVSMHPASVQSASMHPQCAPTTYRTASPAYATAYGAPHLVPLSTASPGSGSVAGGARGYAAPAISVLMRRQ